MRTWIKYLPYSREFKCALLIKKSTFCQKIKVLKIPFISNLKKPKCAFKQDVLELAILWYIPKIWLLPSLFREVYFQRNELTWVLKCNWLLNNFVFYLERIKKSSKEIFIFSLTDMRVKFGQNECRQQVRLEIPNSICVTISLILLMIFSLKLMTNLCFVFNWAGLKPRRSPNKGVRPRPFSC